MRECFRIWGNKPSRRLNILCCRLPSVTLETSKYWSGNRDRSLRHESSEPDQLYSCSKIHSSGRFAAFRGGVWPENPRVKNAVANPIDALAVRESPFSNRCLMQSYPPDRHQKCSNRVWIARARRPRSVRGIPVFSSATISALKRICSQIVDLPSLAATNSCFC